MLLFIRRDTDLANLNSRLEDEQGVVNSTKRKVKEVEVSQIFVNKYTYISDWYHSCKT